MLRLHPSITTCRGLILAGVLAASLALAPHGHAQQEPTPIPPPPGCESIQTPAAGEPTPNAAAIIRACSTAAAETISGAIATATARAGASPDGAAPDGTAPVEAPSDGASGEVAEALPPADLPASNQQGYSFQLEASLAASLDEVATEAPVYRLGVPDPTIEAAQALAERLGITGTVEDRGGQTFVASGEGDLFVTPTLTQYLSPVAAGGGELPADETAVELAREWLRSAGLAPPDLGDGMVVSRSAETNRLVVQFEPLEPTPILAGYPSITVTLAPDGTVLEASARWAEIEQADLYVLRPAEEAWAEVQTGQVYLEADLTDAGIEPGSDIVGTVEYTDIGIAYTTAGPPGDGQYLAPVYVFTGRGTIEGQDQPYPISAYAPALVNANSPVGSTAGENGR